MRLSKDGRPARLVCGPTHAGGHVNSDGFSSGGCSWMGCRGLKNRRGGVFGGGRGGQLPSWEFEMIQRIRILEPHHVVINADDFVAFEDVAFPVNAGVDGGYAAAGLMPDGFKLPFADRRGVGAGPPRGHIPVQKERVAVAAGGPAGEMQGKVLAGNAGAGGPA